MPNNPLYNQLNGGNTNNAQGFIAQFQQFRSMFQGDPRQTIQQMLNSGRISQAQYNNAVQMATKLRNLLK